MISIFVSWKKENTPIETPVNTDRSREYANIVVEFNNTTDLAIVFRWHVRFAESWQVPHGIELKEKYEVLEKLQNQVHWHSRIWLLSRRS